MAISPIHAIGQIAATIAPAGSKSGGAEFSSLLSQALTNVESGQQQSSVAMDRFLSGEDTEVHQVALATQQAEMQFDLFMQVRNKVIAAYQEVMKMQL